MQTALRKSALGAVLAGCLLLPGCYNRGFSVSSGAPAGTLGTPGIPQGSNLGASISVSSGDRIITGILVAVMLVEGVRYYVRGDDGTMTPVNYVPELDPSRKVSEQDCSRPIDPERGNLRCR
jgi:hypothetical protein